jgi:magnesium-transporting ATPase (P-type)
MAPPRPSAPSAAPSGGGQHQQPYDVDEHLLSVAEVAHRYGTHVDASHPDHSRGLNEDDVPRLRQKYGRNAMTPPHRTPEWVKVLQQFANPLLLMLSLACALTFMVYGVQQPRNPDNVILATVMGAVVVVLALTSYWQERSAGNVMGEFFWGCFVLLSERWG